MRRKIVEATPLRRILSDLKAGVSVTGEDRPAQGGELGVLKVSCVANGEFRPSENKAVIDPREQKRLQLQVRKGDILISRANTAELVGSSGIAGATWEHLYLSDKIWRTSIVDPHRDDAGWVLAVLNSPEIRNEIRTRASGTSGSMKNIAKRAFLGIEIPRPALEKQRQLAEFMSLFASGATLVHELLKAQNQLRQGLMQRLLTGQVRVLGGSAPWRVVELGELFSERSETDSAHLPLLSVTSGSGVVLRDSLTRRNTSADDKSKYLRVYPGDIVYNTMRMWQGVSALSSLAGIVSPAYTVCVPGPDVDARFAGWLFKLPRVIHTFYQHSQGLVSDTWNLKFEQFARIRVTIPSLVEQRRIADVLDLVDREIELLQRQRELLEKQKRTAMKKLLSGEVCQDADD